MTGKRREEDEEKDGTFSEALFFIQQRNTV
jgi:hypothetical protein